MPRFRFSLRNFFLFLFVATLIGSNLFTAREVNRLRQANEQFQAELGFVVVTDPNKLHAIAVETHEDLTWRWRLHVPRLRGLQLFVANKNIPQDGLPTDYRIAELPDDDFSVNAAIRRDHLDQWRVAVHYPAGYLAMVIAEEHSGWVKDNLGFRAKQAGTSGQQTTNPGEPMVLLRLRAMQKTEGGSSRIVPEPCDGLMLWIAEPKR
jgi:hypothetical protein